MGGGYGGRGGYGGGGYGGGGYGGRGGYDGGRDRGYGGRTRDSGYGGGRGGGGAGGGGRTNDASTVFMGGLSYDSSEHDIKDFFSKERLNPMKVRLLSDPNTGKFKGAAFVEFDRETDAQQACRLDGKEMGSQRRRVRINPAGNRPGGK